MKESLKELSEVRTLIEQATVTVGRIEKLIPPTSQNQGWLSWRVAGLKRRLDDAKREMMELTESLQSKLIHMQREREHGDEVGYVISKNPAERAILAVTAPDEKHLPLPKAQLQGRILAAIGDDATRRFCEALDKVKPGEPILVRYEYSIDGVLTPRIARIVDPGPDTPVLFAYCKTDKSRSKSELAGLLVPLMVSGVASLATL